MDDVRTLDNADLVNMVWRIAHMYGRETNEPLPCNPNELMAELLRRLDAPNDDYEYPPEIKSICERCEANVVRFSNDDVSTLLCEIDRLAKLAGRLDAPAGKLDVEKAVREIYLETEGFTPLGKREFVPTKADYAEMEKIRVILRRALASPRPASEQEEKS